MKDMSQSQIVAELHLYPPDKGGRQGPTPRECFRVPLEFEGEMFDSALMLRDFGPLFPGAVATVPIVFLNPILILPRLKPGSRFTLWEGKAIADGIVREVLPSNMDVPRR